MSDAPAVPAVSSFDPVEWTKKINRLQEELNRLTNENLDLKRDLVREKSAAAAARGAMKPIKDEMDVLRAKLAASDNLKELGRLRTELAKIHSERARRERERAEEDKKTKADHDELNRRAIRAEGKFQALESTATMMAQARDRANEAAAKLFAERDDAQKKVTDLTEELAQTRAELVRANMDLKAAKVSQAPQALAKAK